MKKNSFCNKCGGNKISSCCNAPIIDGYFCGVCLDNCNNICISCFLNNDCYGDFTYNDFLNAFQNAVNGGLQSGNEWELKIKEWLEPPQELKPKP